MIVLAVLSLIAVFIAASRWKRSRLPLPPGPKPWPILGNILDMPLVRPWEKYREWCQTYNVIFLDLPMNPTVILGSTKAALDLMDKRSNIYSDKPTSTIIKMLSWDFNIAFMPYTNRWRAHRRMFHQEFYQGMVKKYQPRQRKQARMALSWLLEDPVNARKHVRQFITSIIFSITYGKVTSMEHEYVTLSQTAVEGVNLAAIPGVWWVEYFPILKHVPSWVPGTASKKFAEKYQPSVTSMVNKPYAEVKAAVSEGIAPPSLAASLIERNLREHGGTDQEAVYNEIAKNVAGIAYAAGADTTTSAASSFLLAMAIFPQVQKRAQAELDRVVGPSRLPEFEDLARMPYIQAVAMETMRWMPVIPFGVPHAVTVDDVYNGYHIPKGSTIIPNAWAMLQNEDDYPKPDLFRPERYLDKNGNIDPTVRDPGTIAFGFGRRICLGRWFSNNTLSIFIASVLHVFDITPGVDSSGKPVDIDAEMEGGLIVNPKHMPCGFEPRSDSARRLIKETELDSDFDE
ncbi:cytochrome P450 [Cristinia sonorae]|uniref:Cytochrome P450 n=1 Tax=Cristinia sonorae TaxID=1940300 RepID=A0A8K0UUH2_9AGAR|nr:cytochrome P450 [Cristinia sonorae]